MNLQKAIIKTYNNSANSSKKGLKLEINDFLVKLNSTKKVILTTKNQTFNYCQLLIAANFSNLIDLDCCKMRLDYLLYFLIISKNKLLNLVSITFEYKLCAIFVQSSSMIFCEIIKMLSKLPTLNTLKIYMKNLHKDVNDIFINLEDSSVKKIKVIQMNIHAKKNTKVSSFYSHFSNNQIISLNLLRCEFNESSYNLLLKGIKVAISLVCLKLDEISFHYISLDSDYDLFNIIENIKNKNQYVKLSVSAIKDQKTNKKYEIHANRCLKMKNNLQSLECFLLNNNKLEVFNFSCIIPSEFYVEYCNIINNFKKNAPNLKKSNQIKD